MVAICRQGESGVQVVEVCRHHGISEQTMVSCYGAGENS